MLKKVFLRIIYYIRTVLTHIRFGKKLSVDGLLSKRWDTQITILKNGMIKFGKNVAFQKNVSISSIGGKCSVGNNVHFNRNCIVISRDEITIGDDVLFGPNVVIYDHDHIFNNEGIQPGYKHGPVVIEKGCWIAANVTILRNTHIGEGSVIGAGAIVKGDIPSHSLVTSNRELVVKPLIKKS